MRPELATPIHVAANPTAFELAWAQVPEPMRLSVISCDTLADPWRGAFYAGVATADTTRPA